MNPSEQIPPPAYFGSLTIDNVKCFKGKHEIDLSDGNGKPAMWTVILGNNNTGKTTLLRCLADLEPIKQDIQNSKSNDYDCVPSKKSILNANSLIQCTWILNELLFEKWSILKAPVKNFSIKNIELPDQIFSKFYNDDEAKLSFSGDAIAIFSSNLPYKVIGNAIIYGYGTSRRMGNTSLADNENQDNTATSFEDNLTLINAEEFILQTDYASNKIESAKFRLEKIKQILTNGLLPDVKDIHCRSIEENNQIKNFVEFETDYGFVRLRELGYGYQVTLAWIVDLAKKMFERYPNSENPLHEPAIVLVDEIDLHLHPEWQRKIIQFLSAQFPKTQFIVTTHSPLIIQSMDDINLVLLEKENDHVIIKQPDLKNYQGWTVEEILDELMGLGENTLSDSYLEYMEEFGRALDEDNYKKAKKAYDKLDKILHPTSHQRKLLRLQMSGLIPETV